MTSFRRICGYLLLIVLVMEITCINPFKKNNDRSGGARRAHSADDVRKEDNNNEDIDQTNNQDTPGRRRFRDITFGKGKE